MNKLFEFLDKVNEYIAKTWEVLGNALISLFAIVATGSIALIYIGIVIFLITLLFQAVGLGFTIVIILLLLIYFKSD